MLVDGRRLLNQVDLILQNDDVLQPHDLHRCQVLRRLRLRAALVGRNQEERSVHDGCTVQHSGHENVVALGGREGGREGGKNFSGKHCTLKAALVGRDQEECSVNDG